MKVMLITLVFVLGLLIPGKGQLTTDPTSKGPVMDRR